MKGCPNARKSMAPILHPSIQSPNSLAPSNLKGTTALGELHTRVCRRIDNLIDPQVMYLGLFSSSVCFILGYPHLACQRVASTLKVSGLGFLGLFLYVLVNGHCRCTSGFTGFFAAVGRADDSIVGLAEWFCAGSIFWETRCFLRPWFLRSYWAGARTTGKILLSQALRQLCKGCATKSGRAVQAVQLESLVSIVPWAYFYMALVSISFSPFAFLRDPL